MTETIQLLNWKLRCAKYNPPKYPLMHPYFIRKERKTHSSLFSVDGM